MKVTFKIEGMMCEHCEKRVKDTIGKFGFVKDSNVSYKTKKAIITVDDGCDISKIAEAIKKEGYDCTIQ